MYWLLYNLTPFTYSTAVQLCDHIFLSYTAPVDEASSKTTGLWHTYSTQYAEFGGYIVTLLWIFPLCLHFWPLQPASQKHCLLYITIMDLTVMPYLVRMRFYATAKPALLCFIYGFIDSITMVTCVYSMILDAVDIPANDSHCGEA